MPIVIIITAVLVVLSYAEGQDSGVEIGICAERFHLPASEVKSLDGKCYRRGHDLELHKP